MAIVTSHFPTTSPNLKCLPLDSKVEINNEKLNNMKINNLKITRKLGVIIELEFR
jgi:hypothetical protein